MSGSSQDDFTGADMFRRLRDIIKRGVVKEVQMQPPRVRVTFGGEHQSGWLQWFTLATSERVDWSAPKVGDPVPPNSTAAERALEAVLSHVGDLPGDIRIIKNPDLCPVDLLPWLAWEYAVTYWNSGWSEQQKRQVIKAAAWQNKHRGTRGAVERALLTVGYESQLQEWFEKVPKGDPYTFGIKIYLLKQMGMDLDLLNTFIAQIFDAKNCRSLLESINFEAEIDGEFYIAGTTAADVVVEIPAEDEGGVKVNGSLFISGVPTAHITVEI
ncbi:phage tail protein I [Enterobacter hormaechei]|uniref:phage tail protein I n=1 Tax=Enterobacter hormaechei TaxID=158836 RepID=UPI0009B30C98|nr:phage tail protein I [Enterobacter hormaechei]HAS1749989.1 phage tail protein I [Enterobacter hormaechei subsp. oharae]